MFTLDTASLSFEARGLDTLLGNATLSVAILTDGEQAYHSILDPCSVGLPDLCPADGNQTGLVKTSVRFSEGSPDSVNLASDVEVRVRVWVNVTTVEQSQRQTACVETLLQAGDGGAESGGKRSDVQGDSDSTNGSNSDGENTGADDSGTEDSGAGSLQAAVSVVL